MGKLTINDKIKIYELWKSGEKGVSELSRLYHLNLSTVVYITRLADRHGVGVLITNLPITVQSLKRTL